MRPAYDKIFFHPNFTCDLCGREVFGGERICAACKKELPFNDDNFCICCGRRSEGGGYCIECRSHVPQFDMARSVFVHEKDAKLLVLRFKGGAKYLAETLTDFLLPKLAYFPDAELLAYVPMTERAEKRRGYNQSRLLCEKLSEWCALPVFEGLEKVQETKSQKSLGFSDRMKNLKDCFKVTSRSGLKNKNVLLLDDTLTTGATSNEIAGRLKSAGAKKVYVLTVTSVPNRKIK